MVTAPEPTTLTIEDEILQMAMNWLQWNFSKNQLQSLLTDFKEQMSTYLPAKLKKYADDLKTKSYLMEDAAAFLRDCFMKLVSGFKIEFSGCCDLLRDKMYKEGMEKFLLKLSSKIYSSPIAS